MNAVLKGILVGAEVFAEKMAEEKIPGADRAIRGVRRLLDKDDANNVEALRDLEIGVITAIESLKKSEVADEELLASATEDMRAAFIKARQALRQPNT